MENGALTPRYALGNDYAERENGIISYILNDPNCLLVWWEMKQTHDEDGIYKTVRQGRSKENLKKLLAA